MDYKLVKYSDKDKEFVYNVKKTVYQKYVEKNWGSWNEKTQREMFEEFLNHSAKDINIIYCGGEKAGFVNGALIDDKVYEQGNICILPKFQNLGIGTQILNKVFEENKGHDIILRVFKQNPAKKLYERLGFEKYGETNSHFLMIKKN